MTNLNREDLAAALRRATVPVRGQGDVGTGFFVGAQLVLTCAHVVSDPSSPVQLEATEHRAAEKAVVVPGSVRANEDLVLLRCVTPAPTVLLAEPTSPSDELYVFGFPRGDYRGGDSIMLRVDGPGVRRGGQRLLKVTDGRIGPGFSGAPTLNLRTGAVCGVVCRSNQHTEIGRLVSVSTVFDVYPELRETAVPDPRWLDLLNDDQVSMCGLRAPGPTLRQYLEAVEKADARHPYAVLLPVTAPPPLSKVYLTQQLTEDDSEDTGAERIESVELTQLAGAQVVGGPGAGKSSLIQHLAAEEARRWLHQDGQGGMVPVPLHASALVGNRGLPEQLADGVGAMLDTTFTLDGAGLTVMLSAEPLPGVPWLVLVDGLDEIVDLTDRRVVMDRIRRHREDSRYRFLVTSRPLPSLPLARGSDATRYPTYQIQPFDRDQLRELAENWLREFGYADPVTEAVRFMTRLARTDLESVATIPLLATTLCVLYGARPDEPLPFSRLELYDRITDLLFRKHRDVRNLRPALVKWAGRDGRTAEHAAEELFDTTAEVLGQFALDCQGLGSPTIHRSRWRSASSRKPITPSAPLSSGIRDELFRASGLLEHHRDGEFQFIHKTIEEYVAARTIVDSSPDSLQRQARGLLAPQSQWPWLQLGVRVFAAAMWLKPESSGQEGADLAKPLGVLLKRRHRRNNHQFLVELHRHGAQLPHPIVDRLIRVLADQIADNRLDDREWLAAVHALSVIDEHRAVTALEDVVGQQRIPWGRRLTAAKSLADVRPEVGQARLERLADGDAPGPYERLRAANALRSFNYELWINVLAKLSVSPEMERLQVEAADLVTRAHGAAGLDLLERISSGSGFTDWVRLEAARVLSNHQPARGLSALTDLCRSQLSDDLRYQAADAAEMAQHGARAPLMMLLAGDSDLSEDVRINAAQAAATDNQPTAVQLLIGFATNPRFGTGARVRATNAVASLNEAAGMRLRLDLIVEPTMENHALAMAKSAAQDAEATATALYQLARQARQDQVRLDAARFAMTLAPETGTQAMRVVATAATSPVIRMDAAQALDRDEAASMLTEMVDIREWAPRHRVEAGRRLADLDRALGRRALDDLAQTLPHSNRVDAAIALASIDRTAAIRRLDQLGRTTGPDTVRIRAAQELEKLSRRTAKELWEHLAIPGKLGLTGRQQAERAVRRLSPPSR